MYQPRYAEAVEWIATNDSPADNDSPEIIAGLVTVRLIAVLFNVPNETVAWDILALRGIGEMRSAFKTQLSKAYSRTRR